MHGVATVKSLVRGMSWSCHFGYRRHPRNGRATKRVATHRGGIGQVVWVWYGIDKGVEMRKYSELMVLNSIYCIRYS